MSEVKVTKSSPNCGNALLPDALLAPRYKVIADYPFCSCNIGDIIPCYESAVFWGIECNDTSGKVYMSDYPHLFKKLEWWEERKIEEMPEYVKQTGMIYGNGEPAPDWYLKVKKHFNAGNGEWRDDSIKIFCAYPDNRSIGISMNYAGFEPTTEPEYLSYIEGLKK